MALARPLLLILRALGLGDLLTAVPALRGLARAFPEHRRVLLAPPSLAALLPLIRTASGRPVVEELIDVRRLQRAPLRSAVAVNLHGRGPQSHRLLLALRPRRLLAFMHPEVPQSGEGPCWRRDEHEVARWCRMLAAHGVHCDPSELRIEPPRSARSPRGMEWPTVVHPGAASAARRWPAKRWAQVAAAERDAGRAVVVSGGSDEVELAHAVARGAGLPDECVLAGRTDLSELAALVAGAGRVICGDTGVGHLATALGTPSLLLFGPTPPQLWGPPSELAHHVVLWHGSSGDPHGSTLDPGLESIAVEDVLHALQRL